MLLSDTAEVSTNQSPFEWATFTLPITVAQLINGLGNYSKFIFIKAYPDIRHYDFNATYEWKLNSGLMVDGYAMNVDQEGKASTLDMIEFIELSARNGAIIDNLMFQLSLNKSSFAECKKKFNLKSIKSNTWKFLQGNISIYLYFNDNGILIKIGKSYYDRDCWIKAGKI